jgi:hypothetical protein
MEASPNEFDAIFLEAVKQDGWALQFVPVKFRTAEICIEAVKMEANALEEVPEKLIVEVKAALDE